MLVGSVAELQRLVRELNEEIPIGVAEQLLAELWREPANGFSYAALGVALLRQGRLQAARQALDRAHYLQPENPQVLYHYGLTLEAAGQITDARIRYEAALRLNPGYAEPRRRLVALDTSPGSPTPGEAPARVLPPPPLPAAPVPPPAPPVSPTFPTQSRAELAPTQSPTPQERLRRTEQPLPDLDWEPEPQPALGGLAGTAIQLWGQQPLLWLVLLAIPNGLAALTIAKTPIPAWAIPLVWLLAMGMGVVPAILGMAGQQVYEQPFFKPWNFTGGRWLRGTVTLAVVLLITVAPVAAGVALRSPLGGELALLVGLLLAAPFHALLAPGLVLAATIGSGGGSALGVALRLAERRTWLHLLLLLVSGLLLGMGLVVVDATLASLLQGPEAGAAHRVFQVAGISLGESVWAAFVTVCGLDALESVTNPVSGEWELAQLTETRRAGE